MRIFPGSSAPSALNVTFSSEVAGAGPTVALSSNLVTYVTPEQQRCAQLTVSASHAVAGEKLSVRGYSLAFRAYGGRGVR